MTQTLRQKIAAWREERRLDRQFKMLERTVPGIRHPIGFLRTGWGRFVRIPLAGLLILGGCFSILPFLGAWMLPLGLLLLAVDVPMLRRPVSALTIRGRRFIQARWRRFRPS